MMMSAATINNQQAAAELYRRRRARAALLPFTQYTMPSFQEFAAHRLMAEHLDRLLFGDLRRLIIVAPPQLGKSELSAVRAPALWLGNHPDLPVILVSYGADRAQLNSKRVKAVLNSPEYKRLFPNVKIKYGSDRQDRWELEGQQDGLLAVGVDGQVTGNGAGFVVIDDPHKDWAEGQSKTKLDGVAEFYKGTLSTRLWADSRLLLIATRWNEDDLIGRVLREEAGEWTVLRLAAKAETQAERDFANTKFYHLDAGLLDPLDREPGTYIAGPRYSDEQLERQEKTMGPLMFGTEYQGAPANVDGGLFNRNDFSIVPTLPAVTGIQMVRWWDKAGSKDKGDYTAGVLMASVPNEDGTKTYYVVDVVRGQWESIERDKIIKSVAENDKVCYTNRGISVQIWSEQEPGSAGKDAASYFGRMLTGFRVNTETSTGSKRVRAEPFASQVGGKNVKLVRGDWNKAFLDELTLFEAGGKNDDQVDAAAGAFNKLNAKRTVGGIISG